MGCHAITSPAGGSIHSRTEPERKRPLGKREAGPREEGGGGGEGAEDRGKEEGDGIRTEQRVRHAVTCEEECFCPALGEPDLSPLHANSLSHSPPLPHTHTRLFPTTCRRMWKLEAAACRLSRIWLQHVSAHAPRARAFPSASRCSGPKTPPHPGHQPIGSCVTALITWWCWWCNLSDTARWKTSVQFTF